MWFVKLTISSVEHQAEVDMGVSTQRLQLKIMVIIPCLSDTIGPYQMDTQASTTQDSTNYQWTQPVNLPNRRVWLDNEKKEKSDLTNSSCDLGVKGFVSCRDL